MRSNAQGSHSGFLQCCCNVGEPQDGHNVCEIMKESAQDSRLATEEDDYPGLQSAPAALPAAITMLGTSTCSQRSAVTHSGVSLRKSAEASEAGAALSADDQRALAALPLPTSLEGSVSYGLAGLEEVLAWKRTAQSLVTPAISRPAPALLPIDHEIRLEQVRRLCRKEAHLRAVDALSLYRAELSDGDLATLDKLCESDEEIRRLRFKETHIRKAIVNVSEQDGEDSAWQTHAAVGSGDSKADLWGRLDAENLATFRLQSSFTEPLFRILSMFYEVDLYPKWVPFVWSCTRLHVVEGGCGDYAQFILYLKYALPWPLKNREAVLYGWGTDCLEMDRVIICALNVPEDATHWWGYSLPDANGAVRIGLELQIAVTPLGDSALNTALDMVVKVDPKIDWLPSALLNWGAQQFVKLMFGNVCSICKTFSKSAYPALVEADERGFYTFLKGALESFVRGELPEGGSLPCSRRCRTAQPT